MTTRHRWTIASILVVGIEPRLSRPVDSRTGGAEHRADERHDGRTARRRTGSRQGPRSTPSGRRRSAPTTATWSSPAHPTSSCRATPTAVRTSSFAIGRREPRRSSAAPWAASRRTITPGTPVISANGRYVAFASFASNLVPGDTNGTLDVFVADLQTGTIVLASVSSGGAAANYGASRAVDQRRWPLRRVRERIRFAGAGRHERLQQRRVRARHAARHDRARQPAA